MNTKRFLIAVLCLMVIAPSRAQDMDKELSDLAAKLAAFTKENGKKKVTVLDFTDLQAGESELGKYVAEQLTVNLVMVKKDFSVLDRANLKKILAEHKLTATGLVDPDNAKKLGQFAGVDAIMLGTITPKGQKISLTAKIITTDTAEIVGAAKAEFISDESVQKLLSAATSDSASGGGDTHSKEGPAILKSFGDLGVILESLRIINGSQYLLTVTLTNLNPKTTLLAAVHCYGIGVNTTIRDPEGYEFQAETSDAEGIPVGYLMAYIGYTGKAATIPPKESVTGTIKYRTREGRRPAAPGLCKVQLEVVRLRQNGEGRITDEMSSNVLTDMKAQ